MRFWRCIEQLAAVVLVLAAGPAPAAAQCAACNNANLANGSESSTALAGSGEEGVYKLRVGTVYSYADSQQVFVGSQAVQNVEQRGSTLHALALSADAVTWRGTGVSAFLPAGTLESRGNGRSARDTGISDFEVRVRQDVLGIFSTTPRDWHVSLALGTVAPTGSYTRTSNPAAFGKSSNPYVSLGRGAWWLLGDLDAGWRSGRWGVIGGVATRTALDDAPDGFRWGHEVRARLGGSFDILESRLQVLATVDQLWRAQSSEEFGGTRVTSISTGGAWLTLTPALRVTATEHWTVMLGARIPLRRDVEGLQNVEGWNGFLGLAWDGELGRPPESVLVHGPGALFALARR